MDSIPGVQSDSYAVLDSLISAPDRMNRVSNPIHALRSGMDAVFDPIDTVQNVINALSDGIDGVNSAMQSV
ncbi:hypothetical protein C7271_21005 [filamentous cyanobacterium CCP5]|nr:hypothetical protein C7271_21005 [filamentous cyanobacterium CCP5]